MQTIFADFSEAESRPSDPAQARIDAVLADRARQKQAGRTTIKAVYARRLADVAEALERAIRVNVLAGAGDEHALTMILTEVKALQTSAGAASMLASPAQRTA